jgi:hypothetical protein
MLALCLCFKDSAAYLEEWLLFHYIQGFRRFYLYNNESSDHWRRVVRPWVRDGLVETIDFPGTAVQAAVYEDCLQRARGKVDWLGFIDDDEFVFSATERPLSEVLKDFRGHAGVAISWVLYGSGANQRAERGWVIERFYRCNGVPDHHVKCIVRPERIQRSVNLGHQFEPVAGYIIVDENGRPMMESLNDQPSGCKLRINHYLIKSWEEWRVRRRRPQANTGQVTPHSEAQWREWDVYWSEHIDRSAQRFLPEMRALRRKRWLRRWWLA